MPSGCHYVMVAYLGPRRAEDPRQVEDRYRFLREHLAALAHVEHRLEKITVVIQTDASSHVHDQHVAPIFPRFVQRTPVEVVRHPNDPGLSYAAMLGVARYSESEFVIFNEDDYIFTLDRFDEYLSQELHAKPEASMICGGVSDYADGKPHAAMSTSIVRTSALRDIQMPTEGLGVPLGMFPQIWWSRELMKSGKLDDWLDDYATAYWLDYASDREVVNLLFRPSVQPSRAFVVPIQALDRVVALHVDRTGKDYQGGGIDRRGRIDYLYGWAGR